MASHGTDVHIVLVLCGWYLPSLLAKEPPRTAFVFIDLVCSLKIQLGWNFWGERCFSYTGLFIEEGGWDPCVVACSAGLCSALAPPPHPRLLTQNSLQCSCLSQQGRLGPPGGGRKLQSGHLAVCVIKGSEL